MSTPRFIVAPEALCGTHVVLTGGEMHHLRVRRLRVGHQVIVSDAQGRDRRGVIVALKRLEAVIELFDDSERPRDSSLHLMLAQALLKADKVDLVVEKATELGVSEIILFTCQRSLQQPSEGRLERWQRIARSAAKQCQRSREPLIAGPISFAELMSHPVNAVRLLFWEEYWGKRDGFTSLARTRAESVLAIVGPEGGFPDSEVTRAQTAGFQSVGLGPRILRAETAAVAAVTLCQFLWGDLGGFGLVAASPHGS